jgi:hypothetical protein
MPGFLGLCLPLVLRGIVPLDGTEQALAVNYERGDLPGSRPAPPGPAPTSSSELCVVSHGTGPLYGNSSIGASLSKNKQRYCDQLGYRCILLSGSRLDASRDAVWDKILAMQLAMSTHACRNWAMWVDSDVVFETMTPIPLEGLINSSLAFSTARTGLCNGVMLVRADEVGQAFLQATWNQTAFAALHREAEQSAMLNLLIHEPLFRDRATILSNSMVSYPEGYVHKHTALSLPNVHVEWRSETIFKLPMFHVTGSRQVRSDRLHWFQRALNASEL